MAEYRFYRGKSDDNPFVAKPAVPLLITGAPGEGRDDPAGYFPGPDLEAAVNTALLLGLPLIITGRPGCGKTQLGRAVAFALGFPHFKFDTKSTSLARDIFYRFDVVGRFHAAQIDKEDREAANPRRHISYEALGTAILLSRPRKEVEEFLPHEGAAAVLRAIRNDGERAALAAAWAKAGQRSVVVIDEVDKAPRDFPNDILNEIEEYKFKIAEFASLGSNEVPPAPDALRPFVIFTSNSEKQLPDAFLRRCVYHHIAEPGAGTIAKIINTRLGAERFKGKAVADATVAQFARDGAEALSRDATRFYIALRNGAVALKKPPGIAELLNWLVSLSGLGADFGKPLAAQGVSILRASMGALVKTEDDRVEMLKQTGTAAGIDTLVAAGQEA